jgi:predicted Zn-dependent protease
MALLPRAPGLRSALLACGLAVGASVALPGCASVRQTLGRELVPVETEVELGQKLARQIESEQTVHADADLQRYVRFVAQPLVDYAWADRPDIDYRITVLDDDRQVNAFALPGGPMYVYTGLLLLAEDEAELAGVLAHELAHVVARHSANRMGTQFGVQLLMSMALGEEPQALARVAADIAGAGALAHFSRDDEREADDIGLRYAAAAGYDPGGLVSLFEKMAGLHDGSPSALETFLASHPAPQERIDRLEARIARQAIDGGQRHAERYQQMTASLR